ncbi:hypothetical protein MAR_019110 [Mya arenaria]|uniref:Kazal-like domain-containing protein n=1 Tax=Mya arenaria TaxID=6604 RepID=A0ABY7EJR3_MYAAR|nr:hypothetical protein MAR_019110 [Mya arenaria]
MPTNGTIDAYQPDTNNNNYNGPQDTTVKPSKRYGTIDAYKPDTNYNNYNGPRETPGKPSKPYGSFATYQPDTNNNNYNDPRVVIVKASQSYGTIDAKRPVTNKNDYNNPGNTKVKAPKPYGAVDAKKPYTNNNNNYNDPLDVTIKVAQSYGTIDNNRLDTNGNHNYNGPRDASQKTSKIYNIINANRLGKKSNNNYNDPNSYIKTYQKTRLRSGSRHENSERLPAVSSVSSHSNDYMKYIPGSLEKTLRKEAKPSPKCKLIPVCGTDSMTYLSECFLPSGVKKMCDGFCPCKRQNAYPETNGNKHGFVSRTKSGSRHPGQTDIKAYNSDTTKIITRTKYGSRHPIVTGAQSGASSISVDGPVSKRTHALASMLAKKIISPRQICEAKCSGVERNPVCSVAGKSYENECLRYCSGESTACAGSCPCMKASIPKLPMGRKASIPKPPQNIVKTKAAPKRNILKQTTTAPRPTTVAPKPVVKTKGIPATSTYTQSEKKGKESDVVSRTVGKAPVVIKHEPVVKAGSVATDVHVVSTTPSGDSGVNGGDSPDSPDGSDSGKSNDGPDRYA